MEICTKRFSTNNAKEEHEASVHMGEKILPCHLYVQSFTRVAFLYGHKRSHHNAVEICTKRFSTNNAKEEHEASVHMGERDCHATYVTRGSRELHFYMGTRGATTTQWKCDQCQKIFSFMQSLKEHKSGKQGLFQ